MLGSFLHGGEMRIQIGAAGFRATIPRAEPNLLPDTNAQISENTDLHKGSLRAFNGLGAPTALTLASAVKTAYLWRVNDTEYWLRFADEVEVARSPIADDANKRVYWTGDRTDLDPAGLPYARMSFTPIAYAGGADYPVNARRLGMLAPTLAPTPVVTGATTQPELAEFRFYVRTYVSDIGEEGPPSDPSIKVSVAPGQSVDLSGMSLGAGEGTGRNITLQRIYRTATGNAFAAFQFVAELPIATTTYNDALAGDALGEVMPSTDWLAPPPGLRGILLMANGVMVGYVGNEICFSEPYLPHAWPPRYRLTVDYPVVALGSFDTTVVVATQGRPYIITGSHPDSMSQKEIELKEPCVSTRSMVSFGHGCMYASKNGLVYVSPSTGAVLRSQGVVSSEEWAAFNPATIRACEYRQMYMAFHGSDEASTKGFLLAPTSPEGGIISLGLKARAIHRDPLNERAYFLDWAKNISVFETGAKLTAVWRSKVFETDPERFTALRVETVVPAVTEVRIYGDGFLHSATVVTNDDPYRLPPGNRARRWEIEVRTTGEIRSVIIAENVQEL